MLVVGGGIAGISAARALLRWGEEVIIVEKEEKLGGLMSQIANCCVSFQTLFPEIEGGEKPTHLYLCQSGGLCADLCPADAIRLKDEEDLTTSQAPQAAPGAYASP